MSYINTTDIQTTLDNQLKTVAGLPQFTPENVQNTANGITAFSRSTLLPAKRTIISLCRNPVVGSTGLYQVDLFYPQGYGFGPAKSMADAVSNAFLPGTLTLQDGITQLFVLTATVYAANGNPIEGAFIQVPIRVEWMINAPV